MHFSENKNVLQFLYKVGTWLIVQSVFYILYGTWTFMKPIKYQKS